MDPTEAGSIDDSFDSKNYEKMDSDVADSVDDSHDSRNCPKMESTAEDSYDSRNYIKMDTAAEDSYSSRNLEVVVQGEEVNYQDCNAEVLASQNEEDQSGEQVYGLINFGDGRENATIYLDTHSIINGQPMILTQNDNGNEIIVLINAEGQPLVHQVIHHNEINFDGLKENDTIIVGEHSQSLEFMKSEDMQVQECEENQELIECSEERISIESGNECCPVGSVDSSQWPVTDGEELKSDSTKMLFIPNPTVVLAPNVQESEERHIYTENTAIIPPQEAKHPKSKLLLLSDVARDHLLLSATQKNNVLAVGEDGGKDLNSPQPEYENSVIVTHTDIEKDPKVAIDESETDECSPSIERDSSDFDSMHTKSVDVTSLLSSTSTRIVDNTVSVIHTISSEVQDSPLENLAKPSSPDYCSDKQFHLPENELPSEILYCNVSRESFRYNLDRSSDNKQIAECTREDLEDNSRLSIPNDSNESVSTVNNANCKELSLASAKKDSPINFIEKSQDLEEETLGIEEDPLGDTEMKDVDSPSDSCAPAATVDESKEVDEASDVSDRTRSNSDFESSLKKNTDNGHIIFSNKKEDVNDPYSEDICDDDDDDISKKPYTSLSKEKILFSTKHMSRPIYKPKWRKPSSIRNLISYSTSQEDTTESETSLSRSQYTFIESDIKQLKEGSNKEESSKSEPMELENSPSGNLVIAESADEEFNGDEVQDSTDQNLREESESQSTREVEMSEAQPLVSVDENSKTVHSEDVSFENALPVNSEAAGPIKTAENESVCITMGSSLAKDNEDFSNNEETLVKPPKKTYIRKKKNLVETKPAVKENIVLFSVDDLDFTGCDKDITETERSLMSDQQKEDSVEQPMNLDYQKEGALSSKENNESDDQLLLSDVQSKVSATYIRKKKSVPPKHGLRSQSLRLHAVPSKLSLENGTSLFHDSKKNSFDSSSSENTSFRHHVPLWTPLQHCNDGASTSFAPQSPIESTPLRSPEQERRKINKSKRDFDRLLNSSPIASKQVKTSHKRHLSKGRTRGILTTKKLSKRLRSKFLDVKKSLSIASSEIGNKNTDTDDSRAKEARIQDLSHETSLLVSQLNNEEVFSCSQCNFSSAYVDNLIEHLKYCKRVFDKAGVNDMDKRQRIRGEPIDYFKTPEELSEFYQHSMKAYKQIQSEEFPVCLPGTDDTDLDSRRAQYGYGEDDVVWVKIKMSDSEYRFWPALIIHLEESYEKKTTKRKKINKKVPKGIRAHVRLINYPKEIKGLKVRHEHIRTFDDYKWNLLCLTEAEKLPDSETFLKAVQSSEVFMRRKFLGLQVKGKEFFSVRDEVGFMTDGASSSEDMEKVERWKTQTARQARYDKLDVERILKFILEGQTDDYVIGIYKGDQGSKKHKIFFDSDPEIFYPLKGRVWFGPCEKKSQQDQLFNYFRALFVNQIGEVNYVTAYVLQVWVPEALVKAISVIENIPLERAEILFESEDSLDEDPSIEDIEKLYS